jgi:hypothetical protein
MPAACANAAHGPPAAFEGLGCALVLSRKEGGLITGTFGFGGPHYARKEQQPYTRSPPSPPIPCSRQRARGSRVRMPLAFERNRGLSQEFF